MSSAILVLLGGWAALDGVAAGQFMISRPLVAAFLAGTLAGDPFTGATVGALLEIYLLVSVPSGGGRYPEPGPAAVAAGAGAAWLPTAGGIAAAVAVALVMGWVGSLTQAWQRTLLGRLAPDPSEGDITPRAVRSAHLRGLALDASRGMLLTLGGMALVRTAQGVLAPTWPLEGPPTRGLLLPGALVSLGVVARGLHSRGRLRWVLFVVGLTAGYLLGRAVPGGIA